MLWLSKSPSSLYFLVKVSSEWTVKHFSLLLVSYEVFTSFCLYIAATVVGLAGSKEADKVTGILSAVYPEAVCRAKQKWGLWPDCLTCLFWAGCNYRSAIIFLYSKMQSTRENAVNESLEEDAVFSQIIQWQR